MVTEALQRLLEGQSNANVARSYNVSEPTNLPPGRAADLSSPKTQRAVDPALFVFSVDSLGRVVTARSPPPPRDSTSKSRGAHPSVLLLGHYRHDTDRHAVGLRHIGGHEVNASLLKTQKEMRVTG